LIGTGQILPDSIDGINLRFLFHGEEEMSKHKDICGSPKAEFELTDDAVELPLS
jgi:hypothetical protein